MAFGPLVAVDPDLGRVGEPGAHLDEGGAEVGVPQVEVVAGHPAVGLGERPRGCAGSGLALGGAVRAVPVRPEVVVERPVLLDQEHHVLDRGRGSAVGDGGHDHGREGELGARPGPAVVAVLAAPRMAGGGQQDQR